MIDRNEWINMIFGTSNPRLLSAVISRLTSESAFRATMLKARREYGTPHGRIAADGGDCQSRGRVSGL
jgi:hypothetical protein